jgi:hypothetical protein
MINDVAPTYNNAVEFLRINAPEVLEALRDVLVTCRADTVAIVLRHEFAQSQSTTLYRAVLAAARDIDSSKDGGIM